MIAMCMVSNDLRKTSLNVTAPPVYEGYMCYAMRCFALLCFAIRTYFALHNRDQIDQINADRDDDDENDAGEMT